MMVDTERRPFPVRSDVDLMAVREATRAAAAAAVFSLVSQTNLVTAVSELARNAVVHGGGGEVRITTVADAGARGIRLVISDSGPGIADIDQALTDGHTTGHGLGLRLGGARRLLDDFRIESAPGQGTTVTITMWVPGTAARSGPAARPRGPFWPPGRAGPSGLSAPPGPPAPGPACRSGPAYRPAHDGRLRRHGRVGRSGW